MILKNGQSCLRDGSAWALCDAFMDCGFIVKRFDKPLQRQQCLSILKRCTGNALCRLFNAWASRVPGASKEPESLATGEIRREFCQTTQI
jgi:hypothetical protein